MKIEFIDPRKVVLNPNNTNDHPPGQIDELAKSINEYGFIVPIGLDENNMLIFGEGRVLAAFVLKLDEVPFIRTDHLTEQQKIAFAITDKNVTSKSVWHAGRLSQMVDNLLESGFNTNLLGFDDSEIERILQNIPNLLPDTIVKTTVAEHEREVPKPKVNKKEIRSKDGQTWFLGKNELTVTVGSEAIDLLLEQWEQITKMRPMLKAEASEKK